MEPELRLIKLLLLGDFRVGKTRLLRSLLGDSTYQEYEPTFGVVYTGKDFEHEPEPTKLMIVRKM